MQRRAGDAGIVNTDGVEARRPHTRMRYKKDMPHIPTLEK